MTFDGRPISDVYQTILTLFNKGNEAICKGDVTENLTIHFRGAEILRQPATWATSKEAITFSAKQVVKDGDNAIELSFLYLDHDDGAVIEILHTKSEDIRCSGNIVGAKKIVNIGEFVPFRLKRFVIRLIAGIVPIGMLSAIILWGFSTGEFRNRPDSDFPFILIAITVVLFFTVILVDILPFFRYRKFPSWSRLKE